MSVSLKYRSDIDGLRALAVLGVVIYHAFPKVLPGGFSGVDIFFVISGYLISGILYKGHREGGFSFREFYARRIRRLFPALITMLVVVMGYGWVVMLPDEFGQVGKHVAAGSVFIQNVVYWKESGYFDVAANLKPLLHLWSLAVEEQFYIFFPILLVLLWRKPRVLVPAMWILLVVTFVVNVVMSVQNGASDFFLTPYRAWEFLGGSLLAWWHYDRGHAEEVPAYREVMAWSGAVMLVGGMILLGKEQAYPGWRALVPVGGTLLVMEAGRGAWVNRKVLSHPAVVWVGLISYPLYLFHWPALSFVHIVKGEIPKPVYLFDALAVALLLTLATYYLVEKPLRHNRSRWVLPSLIAAFLACAISGILIWKGTIQSRIPQGVDRILTAVSDRDMLAAWPQVPFENGLIVNRIGGHGKQTLYFGDSFMQHYAPRIKRHLEESPSSDRGAIMIATGGMLPIPHVTIQGTDKNTSDRLFAVLDRYLSEDKAIDRLVIASKWGVYFTRRYYDWRYRGQPLSSKEGKDAALREFDHELKLLKSRVPDVTVVMESPFGERLNPHQCIMRGFAGVTPGEPEFLEKEFLAEYGGVLGEIRSIAKANGVRIIEPRDELCRDGKCLVVDSEGVPIRYDGGHLRPGYVREHVKYLDFTVEP